MDSEGRRYNGHIYFTHLGNQQALLRCLGKKIHTHIPPTVLRTSSHYSPNRKSLNMYL